MDPSDQHGPGYWYAQAIMMIGTAKSLQSAVKGLEKDVDETELSDNWMFKDRFYAVAILLSLAIEIALKAWQCSEREKEPDRTHDLLCLFDSLEQDTQHMLEARMRKLSPQSIWADEPSIEKWPPELRDELPARRQPLRWVLESHRKAFEYWRYHYEKRPFAIFETNEMDLALTVIIDAYYERRRP